VRLLSATLIYKEIYVYNIINILKLKGTSPAEEKKEREEKKMTLFRKLSFRPTVEELKARKVKEKSWIRAMLNVI